MTNNVIGPIVFYPAGTGCWPSVGSMLARQLQRRPNVVLTPRICWVYV